MHDHDIDDLDLAVRLLIVCFLVYNFLL